MSSQSPREHRAYRVLLRLYPRRFRKEAAGELRQVFSDAHAEARAGGSRRVLVLWLGVLWDLVRSAGSEHVAEWRRGHTRDRSERRKMVERMGEGWRDIRHGARGLARSPAFTTVAVVILALGIGANTTMFAILDAVYFDPPPHVTEPDALVRIYRTSRTAETGALAYPDYAYFRDQNDVFDGILAYDPDGVAVTVEFDGDPRPARGMFVSHNYFDVLGTRPVAGRWFLEEEDRDPGTHHVVVLSYSLWNRTFGGAPDIVGKPLTLNGTPFTIVGVAPEGFRGPSPIESPPDLWVPIHTQPTLAPAGGLFTLRRIPDNNWVWLWSMARLRPGVTPEAAQAQLSSMAGVLEESFRAWNDGWGARIYPNYRFHPPGGQSLAAMTRMLFAVVAIVLLIASANVAILLLARGSTRMRDTALKVAVGAGRRRLIRSALTESLLLAGLGAAGGVLLAYGATDVVAALLPTTFSAPLDPDGSVVAFAVVLAVSTAVLFGLTPALQSTRVDPASALKESGRGAGSHRTRDGLVVAQVALSLVLTIASGLLVKSLSNATSVPLGFEVDDRVLVATNFRHNGYDRAATEAFVSRALERIRAIPGVQSATTLRMTPFRGRWSTTLQLPGTVPGEADPIELGLNAVGPGFFTTMGIEILSGRAIDATDTDDSPGTIVVSRATATRLWPEGSPLGQILTDEDGERRWTVVGVAEDARFYELGTVPPVYGYRPLSQSDSPTVTFLAHGSSAALGEQVRHALLALDPTLALGSVRTMADAVDREVGRFRTAALLVGAFGALALLLTVVGLYGVLSYSVQQRTRDIGVRVALGASMARVAREVLRKGLRLTVLGALVGLAVSLAGGTLIAGFLYGVEPRDPLTVILAPLGLVGIAAVACLLPARRAARVEPMDALRSD